MTEAVLIGFLITTSATMALLSARRVLTTRTVDGLKPATQILSFCCMASWGVYGLFNEMPFQVLTNGLSMSGVAVVIWMGIRTSSFRRRSVIAPAALYVLASVAAALVLGSEGIVLVSSLVLFGRSLPEVIEAWIRPGGHGISIGSFTVLATQSAMWSLIGFQHADMWVALTSLFALSQAAYMAARTLVGRRRADQFEVETAPTQPVPAVRLEAA